MDQGWVTPPGDLADGIPRPRRRLPGTPDPNIAPFKGRVVLVRTTAGPAAHRRFWRHEKPPTGDTESDARRIDGATVDGVIHALSTVPVPDETRNAVDQGWVTPPGDLADGIPRPRRRPTGAPDPNIAPFKGRVVGSYDPGSRRRMAVSMAMPVRLVH
ncbi:MAG: hypothetical protein OXK76_06625, partial [Gammaproteobacteria bacterium]|nr:hypothetical protein [Gammaproteobacteria bacterium]